MVIKIVDLPMNSMVDLSMAMLNYQRVMIMMKSWIWRYSTALFRQTHIFNVIQFGRGIGNNHDGDMSWY